MESQKPAGDGNSDFGPRLTLGSQDKDTQRGPDQGETREAPTEPSFSRCSWDGHASHALLHRAYWQTLNSWNSRGLLGHFCPIL